MPSWGPNFVNKLIFILLRTLSKESNWRRISLPEKLQINGQIKLYTIYTNTVNRQMELAGRTNYHIYISNKFTSFLQDWFPFTSHENTFLFW
jgi:hypothetical protein